MKEILGNDIKDIRPPSSEGYRNIKPKNEMSAKELSETVADEFKKAAEVGLSEEGKETTSTEANLDPMHKDCLTTSEARKELANKSRGEWSDEPGNSVFHPEDAEAKEALKEYKQKGIEYIDGEPDFSKVSEATVEIDDMTSSRPYNFKQADEVCAKQWNETQREGRTDWTAREVEAWRKENRYSWHERLDMKTMDLAQRDIHEECKHYGGVAECRRHESLDGGGFDE